MTDQLHKESVATPNCDRLEGDSLDSNDLRAWKRLASALERELTQANAIARELVRRAETAERSISDATPRWIPVSERLPEPGTFPLICGPKWMLVASYGSNGGSKPYFKAHGAYFEPTHWMPLPEPPK